MLVDLPKRPPKPRAKRRTHVLDKGASVDWLRGYLDDHSDLIDLVKLGWGTGLVTSNLDAKIAIYAERDVDVCFGGTLFELMWIHGRVDEYESWLQELGVSTVEISDGAVEMESSEKLRFIERFAENFTVLSEVGSKDASAIVTPARWVEAVLQEMAAGAEYVILEGRESDSAGMYRESGEIRMGLIDEIVEAGVPVDRLVLEASKKPHQAWLIRHLGPDVNFGNVPIEETVALETLRLGLRADTLTLFHPIESS